MTRLRPVPEHPQRAVGYVRVSTAREEMISPELQRATIESYCAQRGYVLSEVIEDLDRTGRNFARAGVQDAIERVERGDAEVIVVWKVSRFGRTRRDWYVHADRVEVAGGSLESATEGFDATTPQGRFTRGMFVEMAALESDLIGETWRDVHAHRIRQGLPHSGRPRFGYRVREDGHFEPDPVTGPILRECYERYVAGEVPRSIAEWLNRSGVRTTGGGEWKPSLLRDMLARGFGAGFLFSHGKRLPGAHEPVIDERTWAAYLRRRERAAGTPARARSAVYPLSGLVVCATCGHRMQMWNGYVGTSRKPQSAYKCSKQDGGCGVCYCSVSVLYDAVKAWLAEEVAGELDDRAATKARGLARQAIARTDISAIVAEVKELDRAIARLTDGYSRGIVPETAFQSTIAELTAQREGLDARVVELSGDVAASKQRTRPVVRSVLRDFDLLAEREPAGLKEVLGQLVSGIVVTPGHHKSLGPRKVRVVPRW